MTSLFKRIMSFRENPGIKMVIFDFDGTLADTRELMLRIIKKHLLTFEISLTKDLIRFFGNTPLEHYLTLTGIPSDLIRSVCAGIHEDFYKEYRKIKPCKNFMYVKSINAKKIILSNNVTFFIEKALNFMEGNFFNKVYGADRFMPNNKAWMIKKIKKKYGLADNEIIYVGDKDIDVDVAREAGVYSAVISNNTSWSSRKDVAIKKPDYQLTDLSKILDVIKQINSEQLSSI